MFLPRVLSLETLKQGEENKKKEKRQLILTIKENHLLSSQLSHFFSL